MISIYEAHRQSEQKRYGKFCRSKEVKKSETHPVWAEKGETGCVLGAGGDGNGCEQVRTDRKDRKARRKSWDGLVSPQATSAPRHAPQAGLRAHLVAKSFRSLTKKSGTAKAIPDFFGRGRRTCLGCRLGRLVACVPLARTRPSARGFGVDVGECSRERGRGRFRPVLPDKSQKSGAGLVLRRNAPKLSEPKRGGQSAGRVYFL